MHAIVIARPGGPEVLELRDVPTPSPARGEVRVRVHATAVNRADLLQCLGGYPAPKDAPQDIPGLEYAGEVDIVGEGVNDLTKGDRVFGIVGGGAYAQYLVAHARTVVKIPDGMPFVEAAAVPEAFITAYDAMVTQGGLTTGETVLISAVGSGVGTAASQIAHAMGARVLGTARKEAKIERARSLGLDEGVVPQGGAFASKVLELTNNRGVDLILELVGGDYVGEDLACTTMRGRILLVGLVAGLRTDLDLGALLRKRITMIGTVLRARPLEEKIAVANAFAHHVVPLLDTRALRPVVDRVLPLAEASAAHAYVATNEGFGKVVLTV
jgi:NADPH:quinone reductase